MKEIAAQIKKNSYIMGATTAELRNNALLTLASLLKESSAIIFAANKHDIERAKKENIATPLLNRLKFDQGKLDDCISGIHDLIKLEDPLNQVSLKSEIREGLQLVKESCPIGVIGIIFESRPDALVQISALCMKSGNSVILKGGREALETNKVLFDLVKRAGTSAGLPEDFCYLVEGREEIAQLLECDRDIDLIIPRGSNDFVKYIMDNSRIPVMGHADGICHVYVDETADIELATSIVINGKTQYPSACNTTETLLVSEYIADTFLPILAQKSAGKITFIAGEEESHFLGIEPSASIDFSTEYSDTILAVKLVPGLEEAIEHINYYGSHHTDCIVSENEDAVEIFMALVDSAGVYHNASTRFADGFRYGFGAEVGISTGKLHARGPVGLPGLVTYKYKLFGKGHLV